MRILVLGSTGMLGFQFFKTSWERGIDVYGIARNTAPICNVIGNNAASKLITLQDTRDLQALDSIISSLKPQFVVNCIGVIKQSLLAENAFESISINALLPHQLEKLGTKYQFRLIHISTDCVFDGKKGMYIESDISNAEDLYGRTKYLGEVGYGSGITLRTSIIGHELSEHKHGLIDWFIGAPPHVKGYKKAVFSGLTTIELSRVILDYILPGNIPAGIYQVSAQPINKYDLLHLVKEVYGLDKEIIADSEVCIDRSLDGGRFESLAGYHCPDWHTLITDMFKDYTSSK
jgi:dTDP-4-dehydrorhamnose reductase